MQISILGAVEVVHGDRSVAVGGARVRALLVRLALSPGRPVSATELSAAIWPEDSPADQVNALQSLVSRLRRVLGDADAIVQAPGGYRLAVEPDSVDAHRFQRLARLGRTALGTGEFARAAAVLAEALALWGDSVPVPADGPFGRGLTELRLGALEDRLEADLRCGRAGDVTGELDMLAAAYPQRERFTALLMDALQAGGRSAEALAAFDRTRRELGESLGMDPSPTLVGRQLAILRGTPAGDPPPTDPPATNPATTNPAPTNPATNPATTNPAPTNPPTNPATTNPAPTDPPPPPDPARTEPPATLVSRTGPPPRRTNLRAELTSFLGRDDDMVRVLAMLAESRLVTLIGPGGAGKTRLAREVGARSLDGAPDGVWLVELAAVTDPVDLAQSVIGGLGVREAALLDNRTSSRRDATEQLLDAFAGQQAVLIMDNCEHLIDAAARLSDDLLANCPGLRILATSREALNITGEALFAVPPLRSTPTDAATTLAEAGRAPAVALFLDRARSVAPEPVTTAAGAGSATLDAVLEICRRLDGLPLAIELAAARTRSLTIEQIRDRLDDRFRLLTGGSRTALPRHRTLRAVVEWSWDLLTDAERELAERVAVFAGGVTVAGAAAVSESAVSESAVSESVEGAAQDLLAGLVDKSLLHRVDDGPVPRYRMLETIREFGADRLRDRDGLRAARDAHAAYFSALAHQAEPEIRTSGQLPWIHLLNAERDNLFAALQHLADVGSADAAVDMAAALGWFWFIRGEHAVAQTWIAIALAVPGGSRTIARTLAEVMKAMNAGIWDDSADAEDDAAILARQLDELRPHLDAERHPMAVVMYCVCVLFSPTDQELLRSVDDLLRSSTGWTRATVLMVQALGAENRGDVGLARRTLPEALRSFRAVGERFGLAGCLESMARIQVLDGNLDGAIEGLAEGRRINTELGSYADAAQGLYWTAACRMRLGQWDAARADLERADEEISRIGTTHGSVMVSTLLADLARLTGDMAEARRLIDQIDRLAEGAHGPSQLRTITLTSAAHLALAEGRLDVARDVLGRAVAVGVKSQDMPVLSSVAVALADLASREQLWVEAAELLGAADALRGAPDPTHPDTIRLTTALVAQLGPAGFAAAGDRTRHTPREVAIGRLRSQVAQ